jgi:hypothetical protein
MTRTVLLSAAVLALLVIPGASSVGAEDARTLHGEFAWTQRDKSGDLEAVFTPTGEGTWDVSFRFEFRESPHTYSGTAEGDLDDGELKGTVTDESGKRTFTFEGESKDGEFSGTHAETTGGKPASTGTLKLSG